MAKLKYRPSDINRLSKEITTLQATVRSETLKMMGEMERKRQEIAKVTKEKNSKEEELKKAVRWYLQEMKFDLTVGVTAEKFAAWSASVAGQMLRQTLKRGSRPKTFVKYVETRMFTLSFEHKLFFINQAIDNYYSSEQKEAVNAFLIEHYPAEYNCALYIRSIIYR